MGGEGGLPGQALRNEARIAEATGNLGRARLLYEEILRQYPDEIGAAYRLADVQQKLGKQNDAVNTYQWIAGQFAAKGELLRAIAALQGILRIDPTHERTQQLLADLYARRKASGAPTPSAPTPNLASPRPAAVAGVPLFAKPPESATQIAPKADGGKKAPFDHTRETVPDLWIPDDGGGAAGKTPAGAMPAAARERDTTPGIVPGEPLRRLKGPGVRPVGWPEAVPMRYANVPLFSSLNTRTFVKVLGQVKVHRIPEETLVVRQNDPGDAVFAIAEGSVRVTKEVASGAMLELAVLPAGSFFGEMAILTGGPRRATVTTVTPSEILEIPKATLDELAAEVPTVAETLRRFCRERLLQTALATGILFRGLPTSDRDLLVHRFRTLDAKPGTKILKEGEHADGLYVLVDGSMQVLKNLGGKQRLLALLKGGDFCGEMSLLSGGVAAATVVVKDHATLLKLTRPICEEVLAAKPELMAAIRRVAEERRSLNETILAGELGGPADGTSPA